MAKKQQVEKPYIVFVPRGLGSEKMDIIRDWVSREGDVEIFPTDPVPVKLPKTIPGITADRQYLWLYDQWIRKSDIELGILLTLYCTTGAYADEVAPGADDISAYDRTTGEGLCLYTFLFQVSIAIPYFLSMIDDPKKAQILDRDKISCVSDDMIPTGTAILKIKREHDDTNLVKGLSDILVLLMDVQEEYCRLCSRIQKNPANASSSESIEASRGRLRDYIVQVERTLHKISIHLETQENQTGKSNSLQNQFNLLLEQVKSQAKTSAPKKIREKKHREPPPDIANRFLKRAQEDAGKQLSDIEAYKILTHITDDVRDYPEFGIVSRGKRPWERSSFERHLRTYRKEHSTPIEGVGGTELQEHPKAHDRNLVISKTLHKETHKAGKAADEIIR